MSLPAVLLSSAMQILLDCASYVPFGSFHSPLACCATFAAAAKEAEDENFSSAGTLRKRPLRHHLDIETFIRFSSLLHCPCTPGFIPCLPIQPLLQSNRNAPLLQSNRNAQMCLSSPQPRRPTASCPLIGSPPSLRFLSHRFPEWSTTGVARSWKSASE